MSDVSRSIYADPYEAVLSDLKAKRDEIDRVIQTLQAFRSGSPVIPTQASGAAEGHLEVVPAESPPLAAAMKSPFLGMTIVDGAKSLLVQRLEPLGNAEIVRSLKAGGMILNSADPVNTVSAVLTRRFNQVGDVVRVGRGMWGLSDWYPEQKFERSRVRPKLVESDHVPAPLNDANRFVEMNEAPVNRSADAP